MREGCNVPATAGQFAMAGTVVRIGWTELTGTCLDVGCMHYVKLRVGAKCTTRKSAANQGKEFGEEEGGEEEERLHDMDRDDVELGVVVRNQRNELAP